MELHLLKGREKRGYTTFGCVWDKGEVKNLDFLLTDGLGNSIPLQSKVMAWWPDKSVKWTAHTADADKMTETVILTSDSSGNNAADISKQIIAYDSGKYTGEFTVETVREATEKAVGEATGKTAYGRCLKVSENSKGYLVNTGKMELLIPKISEGGECSGNSFLAEQIKINDIMLANSIYPVFITEHRKEVRSKTKTGYKTVKYHENEKFNGEITSVDLEENGELTACFCYKGKHITGEDTEAVMPFVIRMYVYAGSEDIRFQHTFLYDGVEEKDFLKGMGIRFDLCMSDNLYDRHIQYAVNEPHFHEVAVMLASSHPRLTRELFVKQLDGEFISYADSEDVRYAVNNLPVWNNYSLYQDSAYHYAIYKNTEEGCCELRCGEGKQALGTMAVNSKSGGIILGIKDFWQKYPSGLEVNGLGEDKTTATVWFYSPKAEAFDFRHYSKRSFPQTCYEGFDFLGASAYGIGVTSECKVRFTDKFSDKESIYAFAQMVQKPPVYIADAEYYHEKKAFGYWSLKTGKTEMEKWLEEQLDKSFDFYKKEIEARHWYGLFDYGDVMHTYDSVRHVWRYDFGGMAWQNTELVPTYWLWLYFLRTGREDVFTLMEAMSRHCSEVDVYHFGDLKGLGSRHNVRHWGCSCKEPRIAMAGHHRFLYYLTGDARLKDIFEEVKDSDYAMIKRETERNKDNNDYQPGTRSGPDWSSFVSNWMTWYEITLDEKYREKIETGIRDLSETPFGLISGPDYLYDVETAHLIYNGESENTPNQHLQICMGGPQIWWELSDMLEDNRMNEMLEDLGAFYYLDKEEKARLTDGRIKERAFGWPMFATAISAYSSKNRNNKVLALQSWQILINDLWKFAGKEGYEATEYAKGRDGKAYTEIPWNTTNIAAQWGLNVIMCLEFIREYLPETMEELECLIKQ